MIRASHRRDCLRAMVALANFLILHKTQSFLQILDFIIKSSIVLRSEERVRMGVSAVVVRTVLSIRTRKDDLNYNLNYIFQQVT